MHASPVNLHYKAQSLKRDAESKRVDRKWAHLKTMEVGQTQTVCRSR